MPECETGVRNKSRSGNRNKEPRSSGAEKLVELWF
jgi:hypothetical protein